MKTGLGGLAYNLAPGDEHEFEDAEADRLIEAGFGAEVRDEAAEKAAAEKAAAEKAAAEKAAAEKPAKKG
jgi:topoisomerase IA-like protein